MENSIHENETLSYIHTNHFGMLTLVPNSFAQDSLPEYVVRQIYFHPRDRPPSQDMGAKLDMLVKDVQQFYADEMERHGFGRKTFRFETDALGKRMRHFVKGKFRAIEYSMDKIGKAHQEINQHFDLFTRIIRGWQLSRLMTHPLIT